MTQRSALMLAVGTLSLGLGACGDSGSSDGGGGASADGTQVLFGVADPCDQDETPQPNRLFTAEELRECPLPSDPVEAAIAGLERTDGSNVDDIVQLRIDKTVAFSSLSSTVTFSLGSGGSVTGLPPFVMLERTGTGTSSFGLVDFVASRSGLKEIRIEPSSDLDFGSEYYVIATRALVDEEEEPQPLQASPEVQVLTGVAEPADLEIEEPEASRLLAERGRLADVLALVASRGRPAIAPEDIVSIHSFQTRLGPERLTRLAKRWDAAFMRGRLDVDIRMDDTALPVAELSPFGPDNPGDFADNVETLMRGRITVPAFLDESGRLQDDWDEGRSIDIPFTLSIPKVGGDLPVTLVIPGFGRGGPDILNLASEKSLSVLFMLDLRCHGRRSPDPLGVCQEERNQGEIDGLVDVLGNNNDPRFAGGAPDGIPDDSGRFFFNGDPGVLRDTQIAATLEILHVLATLRTAGEELEGAASISLQGGGRMRLLAHAQASQVTLAAMALYASYPSDPEIRQKDRLTRALFLGGGVGLKEIVESGPSRMLEDFISSAPDGITEDNVSRYLQTLEARVLEALDPDVLGPEAQRLFDSTDNDAAIFYPGVAPLDVSTAARRKLDEVLDPSFFESANSISCEHFLLFSCPDDTLNATRQQRPRAATFIASGSFP